MESVADRIVRTLELMKLADERVKQENISNAFSSVVSMTQVRKPSKPKIKPKVENSPVSFLEQKRKYIAYLTRSKYRRAR